MSTDRTADGGRRKRGLGLLLALLLGLVAPYDGWTIPAQGTKRQGLKTVQQAGKKQVVIKRRPAQKVRRMSDVGRRTGKKQTGTRKLSLLPVKPAAHARPAAKNLPRRQAHRQAVAAAHKVTPTRKVKPGPVAPQSKPPRHPPSAIRRPSPPRAKPKLHPNAKPTTRPTPRSAKSPTPTPRPTPDARRPISLPPLLAVGVPPPGEDVRRARRLAMSPGGERVAVLEEAGNKRFRLHQFDLSGRWLNTFTIDYPWMRDPGDTDRIALALDDEGRFYTNASSAQVIDKLSPDGELIGTVGDPVPGGWTDLIVARSGPGGKSGALYGLDGAGKLVKVLSLEDGRLLKIYFLSPVRSPYRLAVDETHQQFYILDYTPAAAPVTSYHVADQGAVIRQSTSTASPILGELPAGAVPRVLDSQTGESVGGNDHWYRVALDDLRVGFVSALLLQPVVVNGSVWRFPQAGEAPLPVSFNEPYRLIGAPRARRYWDPVPVQRWQGLRVGREGGLYILVKVAPTRETPSLHVFELQPDSRTYRMSQPVAGGPWTEADLAADRDGNLYVIGATGIPTILGREGQVQRWLGAGPLDTTALINPQAVFARRIKVSTPLLQATPSSTPSAVGRPTVPSPQPTIDQEHIFVLDRGAQAVTEFGRDGAFHLRSVLPTGELEPAWSGDLVVDARGRITVARGLQGDVYHLQGLIMDPGGRVSPARALASSPQVPERLEVMIDGTGRWLVRARGTSLTGTASLRLYGSSQQPLAQWNEGPDLYRDLPEIWRRQMDGKSLRVASLDDRTYLYLLGRDRRNPSTWRLIQAIVTDDLALQVTRELHLAPAAAGHKPAVRPKVAVPPLPMQGPPTVVRIGHDRSNRVYILRLAGDRYELVLLHPRGWVLRRAFVDGLAEARDLAVGEDGDVWIVDRTGVRKFRFP